MGTIVFVKIKPCKDVRIRNHGQLTRRCLRDCERASPFGKVTAISFILNASLLQIVQAFRSILVLRTK